MDAEPGTKWAYNSGGSQLMSGIIRHATGRFIDDYAREHAVPAARHPRLPLEENADRTSGHGRRPVPVG